MAPNFAHPCELILFLLLWMTRTGDATDQQTSKFYALPMTKYGCPPEGFVSSGVIRFKATKPIEYPAGNGLLNAPQNGSLDLAFCVGQLENMGQLPYGRYCTLIVHGQYCPRGFTNKNLRLPIEEGHRPSGLSPYVSTHDDLEGVSIEFCCMNIEGATSPIQLPFSRPFFLFPVNGNCQAVSNMTVELQYIRWPVSLALTGWKYFEESTDDSFETGHYPIRANKSGNYIDMFLCFYTTQNDILSTSVYGSIGYFVQGKASGCPQYEKWNQHILDIGKTEMNTGQFYLGEPPERLEVALCVGNMADIVQNVSSFSWPMGKYCLLLLNDTLCPQGLEKEINPARLRDFSNMYTKHGILGLCCSQTGHVDTAIHLPIKPPFSFISPSEENECQQVINTTIGKYVIKWSTFSPPSTSVKEIPKANHTGSEFTLHLCYYTAQGAHVKSYLLGVAVAAIVVVIV